MANDVFNEAEKARARRTEKRHELAREAARAVAERRRRAVGEDASRRVAVEFLTL